MSDISKNFIELGRYLSDKGYASGGAGNMSVKQDNYYIICSPTNSNLGALKDEELSIINSSGTHIKGNKPSKEISFHKAVYEKYSDARVVIHLHSTYLTAYSCLKGLDPENAIKPFTPYVVMRLGRIPLIPYYKPGSEKIAEDVLKLPCDVSCFLMANHGVTVFGNSINDACQKFEELEETARLFFILKGHDIRYLSDTEIKELRGGA